MNRVEDHYEQLLAERYTWMLGGDIESDAVAVHDIVYTPTDDGWQMVKSSYPKLRVAAGWLADRVETAALRVDYHEPTRSGMWTMLARKPSSR